MSKKTAKKSEPKPVYISPNDPDLRRLVAEIKSLYPTIRITTIEALRIACRDFLARQKED